MLELIFQGLFEWIYDMILEVWNYFCSSMIDIMSLDFNYLQTRMPVITDIRQVLLGVGWALLIGNLVFQATRSMIAGLGFEGEDPKLLFARTFVFAFLLVASPQICELGLNMTSAIMTMLDMPDAIDVHLVDDSLFGSLSANWLVVIIMDIILMFKVLKLLIAVAERYVILAVLTITAPLAFGVGGSKNTSDIFSGWCRMYGSMCLLMCVNIIFLKMLLSVVSSIPSGMDAFLWMVLVLAIANVAKKADNIITRIGLNPTISSGANSRIPGMLSYIVVRAASSSITKALGKSGGSSGRGRSPGGSGGGGPRVGPTTPPGGSGGATTAGTGSAGGSTPHSGSPGGGSGSGSAPAIAASESTYTAENGTQITGGSQVHAQQGGGLQSNTQLGGDAPGGGVNLGGPRSTTQQQTTDSTKVNNGGVKQAGRAPNGQTRKTSVPRGIRRGASHVRLTPMNPASPGAGTPGKPAGTAGTPAPGAKAGPSSPMPKPDSKGSATNATTRVTQATGQKFQGGAVNSTVKAAEQSSVATGKTTHTSSHPVGKEPAAGAVPGTTSKETVKQSASPGTAETRSTRRPDTATPRAIPGTPGQPGTAGKAASAAKQGPAPESRHSRNAATPLAADTTTKRETSAPARQEQQTPPATTVSTTKLETSSPARQEVRPTPAGVTPPAKQTASTRRPGTAGTAAQAQRASQGQQPAMRQAARAPSTPTAKDSRNIKKTASTATATKKEQPTRKTSGKPPKPPTLKGGTGHG